MDPEATRHKTLSFGEYVLDSTRGALLRRGEELRLRPKSFEVLRFLAGNAGRLVTKDEIFTAVWGQTVVTDDSLTQCLIDVRRALGDESHELIRTVPRRGYVFEIPVSVEGESPQAGDGTIGVPPARASLHWLAVAAAVAVAALVAWWGAARFGAEQPAAQAPANTIAVLAFLDLSEAGDHQYFADGVAEEILNLLARIPELRVVARTSSFSFRDANADVSAIGRALDVAYLLEGSVRRAGDRVRVTAQLVEATSGAHVWSENYDRELDDLLAVQTDIAGRVARSLEITLSEDVLAPRRRAVNPQAYEHVLHGLFLHNRRAPGDPALVEEHFRQAIALDPEYAAAWAGLSGAQMIRVFEDEVEPAAGLEAARVSALRAVDLDPTLPEAHLRAASVLAHLGEFLRSQEHFARAQALGPNNPLLLAMAAGRHAGQGHIEDAIELSRRAATLDPLSQVNRGNLAWYLALGGRCEEALTELRRARELSLGDGTERPLEAQCLAVLGRHEESLVAAQALPDGAQRDQILALAFRGLGRESEARAALQRLVSSSHPVRSLLLAEVYAQWGDVDAAFALVPAIRRESDAEAVTPGGKGRLNWIISSPMLRPLHADQRWAPLLAEAQERGTLGQNP